jgi:putative addiction module CopG family antidote
MATVTVNVSLPTELKKEADELVASGNYASFSDIVRASLRQSIRDKKYNDLYEQAKQDVVTGKTKELVGRDGIDNFINDLVK